ncbi:hypothetical protein LOY55_28950 [Pseudomonas sp. B21-040]|jgi:hypothetical protein|uniref:hypothetical protein n=1 Tax=unclassified Pseudomonas TaxID=196821 RepID=UPI000D7AAD0B|nr:MULTISPECIES: hypothetical protein [unclassified Pseudomonas]PWK43100.1 hypothetical protein C7534_104274 [Pseudomonas sp. OV226]UVL40181.1 hypothetical protein LOY55_28950 [Pseudomonas sp. B21-040]
MTIIAPRATTGFSQSPIGLSPEHLSSQLTGLPLIGCESRSGLFHFIPSLAPWDCVVPMEIFTGAPIFVDSLRVVVSVNDREFQIGDQVRVQWQALGGSGKSYQSPPQPVLSFTSLQFAVPDETARPFEGDRVEVIFVIERGGSALPSASLYMTFAQALIQTAPISIDDVSEGVLDIDQHPDGVFLTIPLIENLRTNNAIEMHWKSSPNGGQGGAWRDYQRKLTVSPDSPLKFRIDSSVYQAHRGESVHLLCSLFLGSGMVPGLNYGMGPRGTLEFTLV